MKQFGCLLVIAWLIGGFGIPAWGNPMNPKPADGDFTLPMPGGLEMVFRPVFIGEGDAPFALRKFNMGDPTGGFRENLTNVVIGGAFQKENSGKADWMYYLGKYEVTEAQYDAVMDPNNTSRRDSQFPVSQVSWFDVQTFMHKYNLWLFEHAKGDLPANEGSAGFVRLPTEIEWEFAARGGVASEQDRFDARHPYPDGISKHEWFGGPSSSHNKVQKIGLLEPNPLFLHDLLGNVAEMTSSRYQIEYYQGRVGGFVSRGGHYTTSQKKLRASFRSEQPFYNRNLQPQKSKTLGFRLALSSIIFASRQTSGVLKTAWADYRAGGVGATSPAAVSTAAPSTQTNVQLAEAISIVERLETLPGLSPTARRDVERLKASFDNIEATVKQAEVDSAYSWVEIAATRALFIKNSFKKVVPKQKAVDLAKQVGNTRMKEALESQVTLILSDIDDMLKRYAKSLERLDKHEQGSVDRAMNRFVDDMIRTNKPDRLKIVNKAVKVHYRQYTQTKRADRDQLRADLKQL